MKILFQLFIILVICNTSVFAMQADDKLISQFKEYLRIIKSISVDFIQTDSKGLEAHGTLLISKPYKFRCNYYPPYPLIIAGNKNYVSIYDYEMQQISRMNAEENIFNFLLIDNINFDKYFRIDEVFEYIDTFEVTIYHENSGRKSRIIFNKLSKQIKSIEIFEDDNLITLNFDNFKQINSFDEELFIIKNPQIFGMPLRFSKEDLKKKMN